MSAVVRTHVEDRVGFVTLARPEAMNAITVAMGRELEQALVDTAAAADVVLVRGAGGNFCVGGDFRELERLRGEGADAMRELFDSFRRACAVIATLPVPVVAVVEGYAMAGGFELMQACDFAVVHPDVRIADNHSNFGQVPGGGSTQRLPRLVGRQRALAHILTGDRLSADEAVAWGLAYRCLPAESFDEAVAELAAGLASKSREALATTKHLVYAGAELSLDDGLELEAKAVLAHLAGDSAAAGISTFTDRAFTDRASTDKGRS